jgi:hypothetical protein
MEIVDVRTGIRKKVIITRAEIGDFKTLTKKRYSFSWKTIRELTAVYKLCIEGNDDIFGVIGLINWSEEKRIEIKLLASSAENIGKEKHYSGIAGCLIAFACREAVIQFGIEACVSLVPKTELIEHYMNNYYMQNAGRQLYLDGPNLMKLLKNYL